jgi:lysyl-tRNA synthetase class 2
MSSALRARAAVIAKIRAFFADRDVLEVDTNIVECGGERSTPFPFTAAFVLSAAAVSHLAIMQTSPEYPMNACAAGGVLSGSWLRCFAAAAAIRVHPEFSMLEWYRPGF